MSQSQPNIDMESIKQLADLVQQIYNNQKLIIPTDVEIIGSINVRNENQTSSVINGLETTNDDSQQNQKINLLEENQKINLLEQNQKINLLEQKQNQKINLLEQKQNQKINLLEQNQNQIINALNQTNSTIAEILKNLIG